MRILWFCVLVNAVLAQSDFGNSYLKNSRLCHQWTCINGKLGLPDSLPSREQFADVLKSLLPSGPWQDVVTKVLDVCYGVRTRRYTNTCPAQALLHCTFDQLIQNCPEENLNKDDACAPLSSLAGFKYMFSQSRYENLEHNLPLEQRPAWFLRNYFNSKCCNIPQLFNATVLKECDFYTMINYYTHTARPNVKTDRIFADRINFARSDSNNIDPPKSEDGDHVKFAELPTTMNVNDTIITDPLDCCDMNDFIQPSIRSECNFELQYPQHDRDRLIIVNNTMATTSVAPVTITTPRPKFMDIKVLPLSCEKETCVFKKLNIVSDTGAVDTHAFSKLLDNVTSLYPTWTKAKARVVTKCLTKPINDYVSECEINKVLACTFDVLSENCPKTNKTDPCRHTSRSVSNSSEILKCQISSSKLRPKNRHQFCGMPNLVTSQVLMDCNMTSLFQLDYKAEPLRPVRKYSWFTAKYVCKELTDSTKCLLNKMGVLNKYGFMDYFRMKDQIRSFTSKHAEWSLLTNLYLNTFTQLPLYPEHCSSPRKLLNVVDSMLSTCPVSKRRNTPECTKLFNDLAKTPQALTTTVRQFWRHFQQGNHISGHTYFQPQPVKHNHKKHVHKKPLYNFGILNSKNVPPVTIIDLKPKTESKNDKPLVILPVYLRTKQVGKGSLSSMRLYNDPTLRSSDPFALHKKIASAHTSTTEIVKP